MGIALGVAALTAVGGTAAAVTLARGPAPEVVGMECLVPGQGSAIIGATAAAPVERCAVALREEHGIEPAPDTVAYRLPDRALVVGPRSGMPPGAVVETEKAPDARLAELHHAITDTYAGTGFEAGRPCQDLERTRSQVVELLDRLGLTGYTFETKTLEEGATDQCVTAGSDVQDRRIVLERRLPTSYPRPTSPDLDPEYQKISRFEELVGAQAARLRSEGATMGDMADMVRRTARRLDVADDVYEIDATLSPGTGPARLYFEVGGKDFFHIYGGE